MGQPGHPLVNHLGLSNIWYTPPAQNRLSFSTLQISLIIIKIIRLFLKYGNIYIISFFYPLLQKYNIYYRSLPHTIEGDTFFSFFRFHYIENELLGLKKELLLRNALYKTYFSAVRIVRSSDWLFVFIASQHLFKFKEFLIESQKQKKLYRNKFYLKNKNKFFLERLFISASILL